MMTDTLKPAELSGELVRFAYRFVREQSEGEWDDAMIAGGAERLIREVTPILQPLLTRIEAERDELKLAICGGEDAPGYAASLSNEKILQVLKDNYASWKRDSELAWDGETANTWKARALSAEAQRDRMREALELARGRITMLMPADLPGSDHPGATHYVLSKVEAALSQGSGEEG